MGTGLGILLMVGCREAPSGNEKSSEQAGSGGQEGGEDTLASLVGEYTLKVNRRSNLDPYGGTSASNYPSSFQLSLRKKGTDLEARVTAPFGTTGKYRVEFHPTRVLSSEKSYRDGKRLDGPVLLTGQFEQAELDSDTYEEFAFALDDAGHITDGAALGYSSIFGLNCEQNASETHVWFDLKAGPDKTAPAARGGEDLVPWRAPILLSEPATMEGDATVEGAEISFIGLSSSGFLPVFNDPFSLSGKTVTISFPALQDTVGNRAPAGATLSFTDLGEPQPSFSFATEQSGSCAGRTTWPRLVRILSKPGATRAHLTLCYEPFPGAFAQDSLIVSAHAPSGGSSQTSLSPTEGLSTLDLALPAETAAIELRSSGCGSIHVVEIEAL